MNEDITLRALVLLMLWGLCTVAALKYPELGAAALTGAGVVTLFVLIMRGTR